MPQKGGLFRDAPRAQQMHFETVGMDQIRLDSRDRSAQAPEVENERGARRTECGRQAPPSPTRSRTAIRDAGITEARERRRKRNDRGGDTERTGGLLQLPRGRRDQDQLPRGADGAKDCGEVEDYTL